MGATYKELIIGMLRSGLLGFGGGPSAIPVIRHEAVTRYHWLNDDEFGETLAIANTLPGPIATKMAAYLGYKTNGWTGAFVSICAHILPTCMAMVFLAAFMKIISHSKTVTTMISAVMPVVAVMLGQMAYEFGEKAIKGLGIGIGIACFILTFILLQVVSLHPGIVITIFLVYGAFHFKYKDRWETKRKNNREDSV